MPPRFDLDLSGQTYRRQNRRTVILRLVRAAVAAGHRPDIVTQHFPQTHPVVSVDGECTSEEFLARLADLRTPRGNRYDPARFFTADDKLFRVDGRTYAITNQWGDDRWDEAIASLQELCPELGIACRAVETTAGGEAEDDGQVNDDAGGAPSSGIFSDENAFIGTAGEYFVLFQLYRRGVLAALAPRGFATVDVIAQFPGGESAVQIQVKTRRRGHGGGWQMSPKHEVAVPRLIFCFVDLEPRVPVTYVMPAEAVAAAVAASYQAWIATPGRDGPHNHNDMRDIQPEWTFPVPGHEDRWMEQYRERWDLILSQCAE